MTKWKGGSPLTAVLDHWLVFPLLLIGNKCSLHTYLGSLSQQTQNYPEKRRSKLVTPALYWPSYLRALHGCQEQRLTHYQTKVLATTQWVKQNLAS